MAACAAGSGPSAASTDHLPLCRGGRRPTVDESHGGRRLWSTITGVRTSPRGPFRVRTVIDPVTGRRVPDPPPGITPWDLRSGRYRRVLRGVYVEASLTLTPLVLARAGLLAAGTNAVSSHHTAARLWGGIVPDDGDVHGAPASRRIVPSPASAAPWWPASR